MDEIARQTIRVCVLDGLIESLEKRVEIQSQIAAMEQAKLDDLKVQMEGFQQEREALLKLNDYGC